MTNDRSCGYDFSSELFQMIMCGPPKYLFYVGAATSEMHVLAYKSRKKLALIPNFQLWVNIMLTDFWWFYQNFWGDESQTKSPTKGKKIHFWVWRHVCVWKRVHFSTRFFWRGKIFHQSANHIFYMTDRCIDRLQSPNSRYGSFWPFQGNFLPLLAPQKSR